MANASALISNFGQNAPRGLFGNTMAGVNQIVTQRRAAEAEAERMAQYTSLMNEFKTSQNPEVLLQMQNIAPERFEGFQQAWGAMDQLQKEQTTKQYGNILSLVNSGNMDLAIPEMENVAKAYEADGDANSATAWRKMMQEVESGDPNNVSAHIAALLGTDDVGREYLGALQSIREAEIADESHYTDIIKTGLELEVGSQEFKNWAGNIGYTIGGQLGKDMVELAQIVNGDIEDPGDLLDFTVDLNDRFFKRTEPYRVIRNSAQGVHDAIDEAIALGGGEGGTWTDDEGKEHTVTAGVADLTAINLFQRIIDDATVRESDISNLANTAGMSNIAERLINKIYRGEPLTDNNRKQIAEMTDFLLSNAENYVDTQVFTSIEAMQQGSGADYTSVFGGYIPRDKRDEDGTMFQEDLGWTNKPKEEAKTSLSELQKAQQAIRARWPNDTTNNSVGKRIEDMTMEELRIGYPKTYAELFGGSTTAPLNNANTGGGTKEVVW